MFPQSQSQSKGGTQRFMNIYKKLKSAVHMIPALPFFILVCFFLLIPFANTILAGFRDPDTGAFTINNFRAVFTKPIYYLGSTEWLEHLEISEK